jgi:hypothetical protein
VAGRPRRAARAPLRRGLRRRRHRAGGDRGRPRRLRRHVLWGAAFEDLLATDLPDGRNIADDYLRRRGWKEGASTRDYIAGLRRSVISLYEVSGLVPGQSMLLRDLVRGGEPVRVSEKRGSEGLRRWDRIATRVVPLRGGAVISGTLMLFEHEASEALLASSGRSGRRRPATSPRPRAGSASRRTRRRWPAC